MLRTLIASFLALALAATMVVLFYESTQADETTRLSNRQEQKQDKQKKKQKKPAEHEKEDKKKEPILAKFMRKKLGASNRVLEGLMTDDFHEIEKGADALKEMSLAEEWRYSNDPTYARYSLVFQDAVRKLKVKAKKSSTDGTALAWMDVTMSCIECHDWVRNVMIADSGLRSLSR